MTKRHFNSTRDKFHAKLVENDEKKAQMMNMLAKISRQQTDTHAEVRGLRDEIGGLRDENERQRAEIGRQRAEIESLNRKIENSMLSQSRIKTSSPMRAIDLDEDVFSSDRCSNDGRAELDACAEAEVDALDLFHSSACEDSANNRGKRACEDSDNNRGKRRRE